LISIVVEIEKDWDRANFPAKSKAKKFLTARWSGLAPQKKSFVLENQCVMLSQTIEWE
jgi:hypothetical protein